MNAICLVLDCLHTGFLGPYGNTWIHTPAWNRLAAEAFTFDFATADSPLLDVACRSYWQFTHALAAPGQEAPSFADRVREAGITPVLMTDDPRVAAHRLAGDFEQVVAIERPAPPQVAEQLDETHFAWCFAQLVDWLEQAPEKYVLWCHLSGLGAVWDAPMDYREAYADADDPEPYGGAELPERRLPPDHDPDEVLGFVHAYAGQVSLLDICLGGLLNWLDDRPTVLAVAGARGFPLGEHGRVGLCDVPLYGELVHVPLLLRTPDRSGAALRSRALVQPADLSATLVDLVGIHAPVEEFGASLLPVVRGERERVRDAVVLAGTGSERAIRTPAWYLRAVEPPELFVKPDDRWEANNVASRCGEVAEELQEALTQACKTPIAPQNLQIPQLSDLLLFGLE